MKKLVAVLVLLSLVTVLVVACGGSPGGGSTTTPVGTTPSSAGGAGTAVHMDGASFLESPVTISKGSSINLINTVTITHVIQNGSWINGVPKPATESGAPVVEMVQFTTTGQSHIIGPFTTAGTYHFYCNIHAQMNLTVIVH